MKEKLKNITLEDGQNAQDYVNSLPKEDRNVATESILQCFQKGIPLNDMEITRLGRAINRKRMGII